MDLKNLSRKEEDFLQNIEFIIKPLKDDGIDIEYEKTISNGHVIQLSLKNCRLDSLSSSIESLSYLENLDLSNNQLTSLPPSIGKLSKLRHLNLSNNGALSVLPETLNGCNRLKSINLQNCNFKEIPLILRRIPSLIEINLSGNPLNPDEAQLVSKKAVNILEYLKNKALNAGITMNFGVVLYDQIKGSNVRIQKFIQVDKEGRLDISGYNVADWEDVWSVLHVNVVSELVFQNCETLIEIPEFFVDKIHSLKKWDLSGCNSLATLPKNIEDLQNLEELSFNGCSSLKSLPESFVRLPNLKKLDLMDCNLIDLPENIGELKTLESLNLNGNKSLTTLPENFGNLQNLSELTLDGCISLITFPESIVKLKKLKKLNLKNCRVGVTLPTFLWDVSSLESLILSDNKELVSLPEDITKFEYLTELDISNCNFNEIPPLLWSLKRLSKLKVQGNPLNPEDKAIETKPADIILDYLRKKATIIVFISHAVVDFETFHIKQISNYLEQQKEISKVFYCEEDMAGNIDEWMLENVPKSQLVLFMASNKSVFDSEDCKDEIQIADRNSIPCIPIKGEDVSWEDLTNLKLARELGLEFDKNNIDQFCQDLYNYICEFKREINLMDKEKRQIGFSKVYERFGLLYKELEQKIESLTKKISDLENLIKKNKND